jgi:hypothetical protein
MRGRIFPKDVRKQEIEAGKGWRYREIRVRRVVNRDFQAPEFVRTPDQGVNQGF